MFVLNYFIYLFKTNPIMILSLNMYLGISLMIMFLSVSFSQWIFIFISLLYSGGMMIMFSFCICMIGKIKTFKLKKKFFFVFLIFMALFMKKFFCSSDLNFNMKESILSLIFMFVLMTVISFILTFGMKSKKCLKTLN